MIEDPSRDRFVSLVSCWEIAIKCSIGRLDLKSPIDQIFDEEIEGNGLVPLGIERRHLLEISALSEVHGDPFDRLLVAQARVENLTLLSNDKMLDSYGVARIW